MRQDIARMETALLQKKDLVENFLGQRPSFLSSHSFVNIFAWEDFFEFEFKLIKENLCIFAHSPLGCFMYLPPLGQEVTQEVINECFDSMYRVNKGKGIARIENVSHAMLALFPQSEFEHYQKGYEYCYYRKDIAELKGNNFKSQRSSCNKFIKNFGHQFVPYTSGMREGCTELYEGWAHKKLEENKNPVYRQCIEENRKVHQRLLGACQELNLTTRVVMIDGKVRAYTAGYPLNENIFCVLLEITDLTVPGLAAFVFREFCGDAGVRKFKFVNVMDDFELENIQRTKMSFKPQILFPSYTIVKK